MCARVFPEKLSRRFRAFNFLFQCTRNIVLSVRRQILHVFQEENSRRSDYEGREACHGGENSQGGPRTRSRFKDFLNGPPPPTLSALFCSSFLCPLFLLPLRYRDRGGSARGDIIPPRGAPLSSSVSRNYSKIYVNEGTKERRNASKCLSPWATPSAILPLLTGSRKGKRPKNGADPGYVRANRGKGKKGAQSEPHLRAQWAPLKPKVMKVSGCLSRSLYSGPDSQPDHPLRHAQDMPIYRVCAREPCLFPGLTPRLCL